MEVKILIGMLKYLEYVKLTLLSYSIKQCQSNPQLLNDLAQHFEGMVDLNVKYRLL